MHALTTATNPAYELGEGGGGQQEMVGVSPETDPLITKVADSPLSITLCDLTYNMATL